jgi:hypothetical protein
MTMITKGNYFSLNKLLNTSDFLNEFKKLEARKNKEKYIKTATELLNSIKDYKLAVVTIGDMTIDQVAPIFERINRTGRRLTIVDLMRAATWSGDFDLNDTINKIRDSLSVKNFEDVPETEILKNVATCAGLGIAKEDINKLRDKSSNELTVISEKCKYAYDLAVDFITQELPIVNYNYIPYALQLTYLVEFFNTCPTPNYMQREKLVKWFWTTSLSRYFASFNSAQLNNDLALMRDFAKNKTDQIQLNNSINYNNFCSDEFRLNKALSKTFTLVLAVNLPMSLLDGTKINLQDALSMVNKIEFHHIFPKAYLKTQGYNNSKIDANTNICMLNLGNNRAISDTKPSIYFKEICDNLGSNKFEVLKSQLISVEAYKAALNDDFNTFCNERSISIQEEAKRLSETKKM